MGPGEKPPEPLSDAPEGMRAPRTSALPSPRLVSPLLSFSFPAIKLGNSNLVFDLAFSSLRGGQVTSERSYHHLAHVPQCSLNAREWLSVPADATAGLGDTFVHFLVYERALQTERPFHCPTPSQQSSVRHKSIYWG